MERDLSEVERIEIELLLEGIYRHYGFDFRDYSMSTLRRRIWHRVRAEGLSTVSGLQEKVLHDPRVMDRLFADFTIHVTEMFRDPTFFLAFREQAVPLLRELPFIRIWHAGCSTGEEVYSMAILLHEEGLLKKTRIYATDLNDAVLRHAKKGKFSLDKMKLYTANYFRSGGKNAFSEYYSAHREYAQFHSFLTEPAVFAQHNLATDHSFNEFQVIICRNVLIYFNSGLQSRVHRLFYDSLSMGGLLGLGGRETISLTEYAGCYDSISEAKRLYRKIR
nr:CheR family methyltransferase [Paenibacillus hamazuiensis]